MRAVLDPNVVVSGLLSPAGNAAWLLHAAQEGEFELIVSVGLLAELERALAYPKLRRRIPAEDARGVLEWLSQLGTVTNDPDARPTVRSVDPEDDYLISLAESERAILVSGDKDLLDLAEQIPVLSPARFRDRLSRR
ncbi:MAG: putative toxin-antitoxin system toxin component, PIN family [Gaiellaceae bacterium]